MALDNPGSLLSSVGQLPTREAHPSLFMARALQLACQGAAHVAPNPMVGAVIVREQTIVSEGFHARYGGLHAEAAAIAYAREQGVDLRGTSLYVTLEPCSHYGKTPPCVEAIIQAGISEVHIAVLDSNPVVAGRGVRYLLDHGVRVHMHEMQSEALFLNRRFFTYHTLQRPYVILKWAQTEDGFIDRLRGPEMPPARISNSLSQALVHRWRAEEMAIMVGTNTAERDDPRLTVRCWHGRNPLRVVIDRTLRLPARLNLFDGRVPTLLFTALDALPNAGHLRGIADLEIVPLDFSLPVLPSIMQELYRRGVLSILVEGGQRLIDSFVEQELWDELRLFVGSGRFHQGIPAPQKPQGIIRERIPLGDTRLEVSLNPHSLQQLGISPSNPSL